MSKMFYTILSFILLKVFDSFELKPLQNLMICLVSGRDLYVIKNLKYVLLYVIKMVKIKSVGDGNGYWGWWDENEFLI